MEATSATARIQDDLSSLDLGTYEARDLAKKSASLQTDVYFHYCILFNQIPYRDNVNNAAEENSSIFSIIRMHWLPSGAKFEPSVL